MDKKRITSLDACRGIAILMVVCFHVVLIYNHPTWVIPLAGLGFLGVQLFFLVSAVSMCYMWEQRRNESARPLKFYIRRAARIAPLFWFAIVFYTLLYGTGPRPDAWNGIGPVDVILTALFLHPFSPSAINSVVPGGWSIGIEMGFYLIFPLLAALQPKRLLMFAFAAFVLLGILGTSIAERFGSGGHYSEFLYYSMLTQLPIFPIGMFIYAITLGEEKIEWLPTIVLVMLWLVTAFVAKYIFGLTSRPYMWIEIGILAAIVWCGLRWSIGQRVLAYIGRLSYSMYLFHFAVLYFLERYFGNGWPFFLGLLATVLITMAIAIVSQRTAEKWSQDAGRRLIAAIDASAAAQLPGSVDKVPP
jgi:exopolysaccharide production protein ExoZ